MKQIIIQKRKIFIAITVLACVWLFAFIFPVEAAPQYFGYYYDDSLAGNNSSITEMARWSNFIIPYGGLTATEYDLLAPNEMKVGPSLRWVFFDGNFKLHSNYAQRWSDFVSANSINEHYSDILTFYLADEPTWNGISYNDLKMAADLVKSQYPSVPISIVEAVPGIANLVVPTSIDWIGFDQYAVLDPSTDASYQNYYALLKSKRSRSDQKIMIVMDSFYWAQHVNAGLNQNNMATIAANYYKFAQSDSDVVAIIGFIWTDNTGISGSEPPWTGARSLPLVVRDEHKRIGQLITSKLNNITSPTIGFISPVSGSMISGTMNAVTSPSSGVVNIKYYINGVHLFDEQDAPYGFTLDTTAYTNGSQTLRAVAYNSAGNTGEASITVTFNNNTSIAVNGACSSARYSCSAGTSASNVSGTSSYTWLCVGSNGGTTASCSETKCSLSSVANGSVFAYPSCTITCNSGYVLSGSSCVVSTVMNGACSSSRYSCSAGVSANKASGTSSYTWSCVGSNGGTTASCSETKTCSTFIYSLWGACQSNNTQSRTVSSSSPLGCVGGYPVLSRSCTYIPTPTQTTLEAIQVKVIGIISEVSNLPKNPSIFDLNSIQQKLLNIMSELQSIKGSLFATDLYYGLYSDDVKKLQEVLKQDKKVYPEGVVNGKFGPATLRAVKRFQLKYGITTENNPGYGYVGSKTREKLNEI